jgi:hypothetical protein
MLQKSSLKQCFGKKVFKAESNTKILKILHKKTRQKALKKW